MRQYVIHLDYSRGRAFCGSPNAIRTTKFESQVTCKNCLASIARAKRSVNWVTFDEV